MIFDGLPSDLQRLLQAFTPQEIQSNPYYVLQTIIKEREAQLRKEKHMLKQLQERQMSESELAELRLKGEIDRIRKEDELKAAAAQKIFED